MSKIVYCVVKFVVSLTSIWHTASPIITACCYASNTVKLVSLQCIRFLYEYSGISIKMGRNSTNSLVAFEVPCRHLIHGSCHRAQQQTTCFLVKRLLKKENGSVLSPAVCGAVVVRATSGGPSTG
jgi:hypothetical protein